MPDQTPRFDVQGGKRSVGPCCDIPRMQRVQRIAHGLIAFDGVAAASIDQVHQKLRSIIFHQTICGGDRDSGQIFGFRRWHATCIIPGHYRLPWQSDRRESHSSHACGLTQGPAPGRASAFASPGLGSALAAGFISCGARPRRSRQVPSDTFALGKDLVPRSKDFHTPRRHEDLALHADVQGSITVLWQIGLKGFTCPG